MIRLDVEQGSREWLEARAGTPSASNFDKIVTTKGEPSKQAKNYLYELAGERIAGPKPETYQSAAMVRGLETEAEAWAARIEAEARARAWAARARAEIRALAEIRAADALARAREKAQAAEILATKAKALAVEALTEVRAAKKRAMMKRTK